MRKSLKQVNGDNALFENQVSSWLCRKHSLVHESLSYAMLRIRESRISERIKWTLSIKTLFDFSVNPNKWNDAEAAEKRVNLASMEVFFLPLIISMAICIIQLFNEIYKFNLLLARLKIGPIRPCIQNKWLRTCIYAFLIVIILSLGMEIN